MMIPEETINEIRNAASIGEVIGHYIPLIRKGKNYTALCPFHDDHDPSLSISEDKQIYKCFVCGNGGNVFTFVQRYKKISYVESVAEVAKIIGKPLDISLSPVKKESKYQHLYDLLNDYIDYASYLLQATKLGLPAKEYLEKRGITEEIVQEFKIGFDPVGNRIYANLKAKGYSDEDMIRTNIGRMGNNGMNEVFERRIVFPIHNRYGDPLAFTARDFEGFSSSKYINSSQTEIYTKGDILFNHHRARESARQLGYVIVCEGVMDVIAYYRAGITNAVATLGTAMSKEQIALLKELARTIVLSYDGDKAGKAANLKNGEALLAENIPVEVIDNKTDLDPDEIVSNYGGHVLRDMASKRSSYLDYAFACYKETYNLNNYSDRKAMTLKLSSLIDKLNDPYDRDNYSRELYELTKIRRIENNAPAKVQRVTHYDRSVSLDGLTKAEYTILAYMAGYETAKDIYLKELGCLLDENNYELANLIIGEYRERGRCSLSRLYDACEKEELKELITSLGSVETLPQDYDEALLRGSIQKVKEEIKKKKLEDLRSRIAQSETVDPEATARYLEEYTELLKEIGGH